MQSFLVCAMKFHVYYKVLLQMKGNNDVRVAKQGIESALMYMNTLVDRVQRIIPNQGSVSLRLVSRPLSPAHMNTSSFRCHR